VALRELQRQLGETHKQLAQCQRYSAISEDQLAGQNSPEEALIRGFFPLLGSNTAVDIGAHAGNFTNFLFSAGFGEVFAFEPHPDLGTKLQSLRTQYPSLRLGEFAVGDRDRRTKLHLAKRQGKARPGEDLLLLSSLKKHPMPEELSFASSVEVQVRSVHSLRKEGLLPERAGLCKIDTEGYDATIVGQLNGETDYEVVLTEFWSNTFIFAENRADEAGDCTMILRGKGYPCTLAIIRTLDGRLSFSANKSPAGLQVPSWGNVFHFKNHEVFRTAYQMLQNMLPEQF
jgi:FkbM family methyltransferase